MTTGSLRTFGVPSPIGLVRCAATSEGLALVTLPGSDFDEQLAPLVAAYGEPRAVKRHPAAAELRRYFDGRLTEFAHPVDLRLVTPFARRVLDALYRVPFGELVTYGELATRAGSPGGSRAVGGVMGRNPVPLVVP